MQSQYFEINNGFSTNYRGPCQEGLDDDDCPGRSSTSTTEENIEAVKNIILDNHRIIIREVADDDSANDMQFLQMF